MIYCYLKLRIILSETLNLLPFINAIIMESK